ncbi:uncharacterized protein EV420DRAFT_1645219 [Desarmillaria tabescens]|uniref:Uncharacterized protein n=1 Tax=Armillaria tabescens TaxID=1929756 RepID=A0AA39K450_ARMTA|nr:uncharacterized protein EV420DRAFT_1645219 [Desarmillaria tabescens]KAK0453998.1 hypothetical protein EV420DRAFT_1645219 [Desarmillaria tabescens]
MTYQLDIPPDLTGPDITFIYQNLDAQLNTGILYALLHGIYTGIVAVSLWNIFTCESRPIGRQIMVVAIILLFVVTTITVGFNWSYINSAFIDNGQSFWSRYSVLLFSPNIFLGMGITGAISSMLADFAMIWRCWMVWGQRWPVVLPPILMLISGIVFKLINTYQAYATGNDYVLGFVLYSSFVLATTILCTALIIYRILTVGRASDGIGGGIGFYRHVIEVFEVRGDWAVYYVDAMSGIVRGIAPTLLVGRVAVGLCTFGRDMAD